jgi:hypothetical protein
MAHGRYRFGEWKVTVLEPCSVTLQAMETALAEELVPADEVVAAHLIEEHQDCQARPFCC